MFAESIGAGMGLLAGAELWSVAIFFAIFLLLVDLMHRRHRWTARYPPGPMSLPVLGNLLQVDFQNMPAGFQKVRKLLEVRRGHQNTVGGSATTCCAGAGAQDKASEEVSFPYGEWYRT